MKKILSSDYFWGNLQLQFLLAKPSNTDGLVDRVASGSKRTELDQWIAKYEQEALEYVLGSDMTRDLITAIEYEPTDPPVPEDEPDPKWAWLKGIIYDDTAKVSFVANYVWFKHDRFTSVKQTARAIVEKKVGNAEVVSNTINSVDIWNEFIVLGRKVQSLIRANEDFANDIYVLPCLHKINEFGI